MLSATNSRTDLKKLLNTQYTEYGYTAEADYNTALDAALNLAMIMHMYPSIGESYYATILAKNKVGLTTTENYIYEAELRFAAYLFLNQIGNKEQQKRATEAISKSRSGVSASGNGRIGKYAAGGQLKKDAMDLMQLAGYYYSAAIFRDGIDTSWRQIYSDEDIILG
jgi:hypothetical protein